MLKPDARKEMDELAARVAHAIGTPLSALIGTVQMCVEDDEGKDPRLDRVLRLGRRVASIVRAMIDLSHSQKLEWSKTSARFLLDEAAGELSDRCAKAGVHLSSRVWPGVPVFEADPALLLTALVSIAENAVDEMRETGGELRLQAEHRVRERESSIVFRVIDSGRGIPRELRKSVFEPFVTTRANGAGLGLSIAKQIVSAHEGEIRIDDNPGGGTVVSVELPVQRSDAQ